MNQDEVIQAEQSLIQLLQGFQATHKQNIANAQAAHEQSIAGAKGAVDTATTNLTAAQDAVTAAQTALDAANADLAKASSAADVALQTVTTNEQATIDEDQRAIDAATAIIQQLGGQSLAPLA